MKSLSTCGLLLTLFTATIALGQEHNFPKPQKEHELLNQFVGEWEAESEAFTGPGKPPMKCKGTTKARMVGGFWVVLDIKFTMMETEVVAVQTIGYDPKSKQFVGTWVDSMLSHMWKYTGTIDDTAKFLTLEADGPNFMLEDKQTKFRDVYEFRSKDHIVLTSSMQGDDGRWVTFMTSQIRRKK